MKKKGCLCTVNCRPYLGPLFGQDIFINDNCTKENSCWILNGCRTGQYEYHPVYKCSLFVNTNEPDIKNPYTVLDYEVFTHD